MVFGATLAIASVLAFYIGRKTAISGDFPGTNEKTDTLYVHDTITVAKAVKIEKRIIDTLRVPVPVPGPRDTVWLELPREAVEWSDSLCTVYASGVFPQVDSVRHYTTTAIVTRTVYRDTSPWGVGVIAGYGAGASGLTPFVGVGVSYRLTFRKKNEEVRKK